MSLGANGHICPSLIPFLWFAFSVFAWVLTCMFLAIFWLMLLTCWVVVHVGYLIILNHFKYGGKRTHKDLLQFLILPTLIMMKSLPATMFSKTFEFTGRVRWRRIKDRLWVHR